MNFVMSWGKKMSFIMSEETTVYCVISIKQSEKSEATMQERMNQEYIFCLQQSGFFCKRQNELRMPTSPLQVMNRSGLAGPPMDNHMDLAHLQMSKHLAVPQQDEPSDLEELEQFAKAFKQRRIKLGFTQVHFFLNVMGKLHWLLNPKLWWYENSWRSMSMNHWWSSRERGHVVLSTAEYKNKMNAPGKMETLYFQLVVHTLQQYRCISGVLQHVFHMDVSHTSGFHLGADFWSSTLPPCVDVTMTAQIVVFDNTMERVPKKKTNVFAFRFIPFVYYCVKLSLLKCRAPARVCSVGSILWDFKARHLLKRDLGRHNNQKTGLSKR